MFRFVQFGAPVAVLGIGYAPHATHSVERHMLMPMDRLTLSLGIRYLYWQSTGARDRYLKAREEQEPIDWKAQEELQRMMEEHIRMKREEQQQLNSSGSK
jgi:hypothetical protein